MLRLIGQVQTLNVCTHCSHIAKFWIDVWILLNAEAALVVVVIADVLELIRANRSSPCSRSCPPRSW